MFFIALKMLMGDRTKYIGLLFGIAFTSFLVTFAGAYFSGFITRGFSLVSENPRIDVWVMDPAVTAPEQTINMSESILNRVRSVDGVKFAAPLALASAAARFPNGHFQTFEIIGIDDATLLGAPKIEQGISSNILRTPDAAFVDSGGSSGKLQTPLLKEDQWPKNGPHLNVATRLLAPGDELLLNDHRVRVAALSQTLPRFPPRPLMYMTYSNAIRILPRERSRLTFVLVIGQAGISPTILAQRIQAQTGMRARSSKDFKADIVRWLLINSEDVGDMAAMLILAMSVGFGVTGIMLFMFTYENLKQYAILKAMGATPATLMAMVFVQAGVCAVLGAFLGVGICAIVGELVSGLGYPFRMMWFTPMLGGVGVLIVSIVAAVISAYPIKYLQPAIVFAGR